MRNIMIFMVIACICSCGNRQSVKLEQKKELPGRINYSQGSGDSYEDAVKITGVRKQSEGLEAEYAYLSSKYGIKNKDWKIVGQTIFREKGNVFDVIEISLVHSSDRRIYYFDVTSFPWKKK